MDVKTDETLLFSNTMRIAEGHLAEFVDAIRVAVEFAERNGPQLMVQTFIDEQRMLAHSYQVYRDSESVLVHWQQSDPYISKVMEHCSVARFEVYGRPSDEVLAGLEGLGSSLAGVWPRIAGFTRLGPGT